MGKYILLEYNLFSFFLQLDTLSWGWSSSTG